VLILAGCAGESSGRNRFTKAKERIPARWKSNSYFYAGFLLLIVEAAYFWFDIDVFNPSTYR